MFNHGSEIFNRGPLSTAELQGDGECAVSCGEINMGCPNKDCIPALTRPEQVGSQSPEAAYLSDSSFVVGVAVGKDVRAYPHNILWWHEIVNDTVGGVPLALTHCPLTFSSIAHDPTKFIAGKTVELGVSGRLFNANLVFYNRSDDTWFSQLLGVGTKGPSLGKLAPRVHVWEMTWAAWKAMNPETTVLSERTGHARNYASYPYGGYFSDHGDMFQRTEPAPDPTYPAKALTDGLRVGGAAKAYVHSELAAWAHAQLGGSKVGVVNDTLGTAKVAVVFDLDAGYVQAFDRTGQADLELAP